MIQKLACLLACVWSIGTSFASEFQFVALGDLPYGKDDTSGERYRSLILKINSIKPAFSIHVGDFKSGSSLCSNEQFSVQRQNFNLFTGAIIYTPGDNDWTDCHRDSNGRYDPLERLNRLRKDFFFSDHSLGQNPIPLLSQATIMPEFSSYVENQRWVSRSVLFFTVHIVGSNNNFDPKDPNKLAEFFERNRANAAWIREAFSLALRQKVEAIVVSFQGDVFLSRSLMNDFPDQSGFRNTINNTLLPLARDFQKPVLIVHGDSHHFLFDQPFSVDQKNLSNVYRLVVPGEQDTRAVNVLVSTSNEAPFSASLIEP